jgi:ABC-type antimicrobial peptide transport system permease subunit
MTFLRDELSEEVLGDLEEKFYKTLKTKSLWKAKATYWCQVLQYVRPFAIRKFKQSQSNGYAMFQNYLKIGWRNLFRQKGYSAVNISGLAAGMTVAMLIGFWIYDELTFNKYHRNYDKIARVMNSGTWNGEVSTGKYLPIPLAPALSQTYEDDFEYVVASTFTEDHIISYKDLKFTQFGNYMHPDAPKMLTLAMVSGTYDGLRELNSIMLSMSLAKTLFGDEDPLNKILQIDNKIDVKVTGVYEDLPTNSQFHGVSFIAPFDLYIVSNDWLKNFVNSWSDGMIQIFVQIPSHGDMALASDKIKNAIHEHIDEEDKKHNIHAFLHPMSKWRLYEEFRNGKNVGGQIRFVLLFGTIGVFVLLLACINFMNLSTARSERRSKEVGIRKTLGSVRRQLISQFFSESILIVILAFLLTLAIVYLAIPWFNVLSNKEISIPLSNPYFWMSCMTFVLLTGIIAGSYPALYLSSFQAVKVLKGTFRVGRFAALPRKVLVVIQFTVSVTLIIGTIIVYQQIQHTRNRPVGYTREGLIYLNMKTDEIHQHFSVVRNELKASGAILEMAESNGSVTKYRANFGGFEWKGKDPNFSDVFAIEWVTPEYGKTVGWQFLDGRDYSPGMNAEQQGLIINESAARYMGLQNPVGEIIRWDNRDWTILGVVKDMVVESPYQPTRQAIYMPLVWPGSVVSLKVNPDRSTHEALAKIESVFKKYVPGMPFDYQFADDQYAQKFNNEVRIGKLASVFAVLAIAISCLGLFGLASFVAEQRTKEIGIRKIAGASVYHLWGMLSKDFVALVFISCFIAIPIAYYYLDSWLEQYRYRIEISWWIFVVTSIGAMVITLLTVSFQAIRAAMMNPVKSLRSE